VNSPPPRLVHYPEGGLSRTHGIALAYQARGWPVFPTYGPDPARASGCSCSDRECSSPGKHPATREGVKAASTEPRMAGIFWSRHSARGIGMATGGDSGVWALDLDGPDGLRELDELTRVNGELPATVASRTGGGGVHLLFRMPRDRDVRNSAKKVGPNIDVRGTGGYIILPPSVHVSGKRYAWEPGRSPAAVGVAEAPGWLLDRVAPLPLPYVAPPVTAAPRGARYAWAAIERECIDLAFTAPGGRNDALNRAAFKVARFVASGDAEVRAVVRALAYAAMAAGLPPSETERTLRSAFRARGIG